MGNIFAITTPAETIKADAGGKASAIFTVTNTSNKPIRGIALAKAIGATQQGWLDVEGETEKDFGAGGTQQFTLNFTASGGEVGKFPFRLDVASATNPDEDFTEGPIVNVQTAAPPPQAVKSGFPLWIILVIGVLVLLIVGLILFIVLRTGSSNPVNTNVNAVKPTEKVTEGMRVRDSSDGAKIYFGIDGQLRWIPNPATYSGLFNQAGFTEIPTVKGYPIGPPLTDGAYLAWAPPDPHTYLIVDGTKRWITSPTAFDRYGFSIQMVRPLPTAELAAIKNGPDIP